MRPIHVFVAMIAGMTFGGLFGTLTRPAYFGMQPPPNILFSSSPADAPYRQEMMSHLATCVGIGAVAASLLLLVSAILTNRQPRA
jgi:hypothetical protein